MYVPFEQLSADARVWIYMSDREWSAVEVEVIREATRSFVQDWTAHQQPLQASFVVRYNHFLIIAVDENSVAASGCSIDKCVAFVKSLEQQLGVNLMNRMLFGYKKEDQVVVATKEEFERLIENDMISDQTLVYDNLVDSVHALNHRWEIPFERSWHKVLVG
jgi:hypothetical protein